MPWLSGRLNQVAGEVTRIADQLAELGRRCRGHAAEVEQTIGGSATQADRKMVETLSEAERQVGEAIAALRAVARIARSQGR